MMQRSKQRPKSTQQKVVELRGAEPRCEGLVIEVGLFESNHRRALILAKRVVRRSLPTGAWRVRPLGPAARDFLVEKSNRKSLNVGLAWNVVKKLKRDRDVVSAEPALVIPGLEPDPRMSPALLLPYERLMPKSGPDDRPLDCAQEYDWSLDLCRVKAAWALEPPATGKRYGAGIRVGHPDTGYTHHAEIWSSDPSQNRVMVAAGHDFLENDADPRDPLKGFSPGHGTATASVIMSDRAVGSRDPFVTGSAPAALLVPLRVNDSVVLFSFSKLAEAIYFAAENDHHVISISLGGVLKSQFLERAIRYAINRGQIILAAAGNTWPWVVYPARFDEVLAVAACNCRGEVWKKSASGPAVDVTAPGESVWVARTGDDKGEMDDFVGMGSGTSFSVAMTAGVCALWLAYHGRDRLIARYGAANLAAVFKEIVLTYGVMTPSGWNKEKYGAGILNAEQVLTAPLPDTPPAVGMAIRSSAPRAKNPMDEFVAYFPGRRPVEVRRGLLRLLNAEEEDLGTLLADDGDELLFHVATNPDIRAALLNGSRRPRSRVRSPALLGDRKFSRTASSGLKARLGLFPRSHK